ncbi:hypothetical protein BC567DRAFT_68061 [Phyllosticta citribraziliensis]
MVWSWSAGGVEMSSMWSVDLGAAERGPAAAETRAATARDETGVPADGRPVLHAALSTSRLHFHARHAFATHSELWSLLATLASCITSTRTARLIAQRRSSARSSLLDGNSRVPAAIWPRSKGRRASGSSNAGPAATSGLCQPPPAKGLHSN